MHASRFPITLLLAVLALACGSENGKGSSGQAPGNPASASAPARAPAAAGSTAAAASRADTGRRGAADTGSVSSASAPARPVSATPQRPPRVRHMNTPNPIRGLYVNRAAARGPEIWRLLALARRTHVNALVFDVKDENGLLLYPSTVGLAQVIGADTVSPMPVRRLQAVMDSLRKYRIFPVARIVVARDPVLAAHRPRWAVLARATDPERSAWLDPRHREVWAYAADVAAEAAARGFGEVQFADVRFPTSTGESERVELTSPDGRTMGEVIRAQLQFLRSRVEQLDVPMAIAVSGLAAVDSSDLGVGQRWEAVADGADVLVLEEFPSRFPPGTFGIANPGAEPYETVKRALDDARRRAAAMPAAAAIVPAYQDFTADGPPYGATEVRDQIRAGEAVGIRSWLLWNPASSYTEEALRVPQSPARSDSAALRRATGRGGARSRR